jgi:hypothetical protein
MDDTELSALPSASALDGTELVPALQTTAKKATATQVATYVSGVLAAASAGTPSAGDDLLGFESGTAKLFDLDALAAYVVASGWTVASEADPAASGDMLLINRSGTKYTLDVDTLADYIEAHTVAGLDNLATQIDDLSAATPGGTDQFVFATTAPVGKKITLTNLETLLWADFATYFNTLGDSGTALTGDEIYVQRGGTNPYSMTVDTLSAFVIADLWDQSAAADVQANDRVITWRSGTGYRYATGTQIATFVNTGLQATALNLSTLSAGAIVGTDLMLICTGSSPTKETAADVAAYVLGTLPAALTALSAVTTADPADLLYTTQSGTAKKLTIQQLFNTVNAGLASFTGAIVPGTDQLLIDDNGTAKRLTFQVLMDGMDDLTALAAAPETTDTLLLGDGGTAKNCTVANLFNTYTDDMTEGTGISGAASEICEHHVTRFGGLYKTEILIDLTSLNSGDADGDIIGKNATANCHIGQITAAKNGTIFAGRVTCLETPATGEPDIDLYSATAATGTEDTPIADLIETALMTAAADWTAGSVKVLTAYPAANEYLYLVASGGATDATYTAGILLIELWGKAA